MTHAVHLKQQAAVEVATAVVAAAHTQWLPPPQLYTLIIFILLPLKPLGAMTHAVHMEGVCSKRDEGSASSSRICSLMSTSGVELFPQLNCTTVSVQVMQNM